MMERDMKKVKENPIAVDDGVKHELVELKNSHDDLRAEEVVAFARNHTESSLYQLFDRNGLWDDSIAAEKMRLHYARILMTRVRLTVLDKTGQACQVRMFVNLSEARKEGTSYLYRQQVLTDEARLRMFLEDAAADVESIVRRYRDVLEVEWISTLESMVLQIRERAVNVRPKRKRKSAPAAKVST